MAGTLLFSFRRPASIPEFPRPVVEIPPLPDRPLLPPARLRSKAPPPELPSPDRLRPFLDRLGRARILRDRRTLETLRARTPLIFDSDLPALLSQLGDDLFISAGIAELARLFAWNDALPVLAELLGSPGHPFLQDVVIDSPSPPAPAA